MPRKDIKEPSASTKRAAAHRARLAEGGGKPIRVDTSGDDLKKVEDLIAVGYADTQAETYRESMREAHRRHVKGKPEGSRKK